MKAYFFLSKKNINKAGLCPVVCRVAASNTERQDFRTGQFLACDQWDFKRGLPVDNEKQAFTTLNTILNDVYAIIAERKRNSNVTVYEVVDTYKQQGQ